MIIKYARAVKLREDILALHSENMRPVEIALRLGITRQRVYQILKKAGITPHKTKIYKIIRSEQN